MAIAIARVAAYCMVLSLVAYSRGVPVSAASFVARQVGLGARSINIAHRRSMSTALGNSKEGLSDIGQPTNSNSNTGGMQSWKERIDVSIAKSRKIRGSNYVQISTVDYETMEPRCRTVVFRGFMKGVPFGAVTGVLPGGGGVGGDGNEGGYDCVMKMITDKRSNKVKELGKFHETKPGQEGVNTMEMVWWFPKSSEQFRIRGRLQFIGNDGPLFSYSDCSDEASEETKSYFVAERKQQWGNLSDMAREQFYWQNPGIPYASTGEHGEGVAAGGRDEEGKVLPPPDAFLLMLLYPTNIDYLRLGDNYRQIDEWNWGNDADGAGGQWKSLRVNP